MRQVYESGVLERRAMSELGSSIRHRLYPEMVERPWDSEKPVVWRWCCLMHFGEARRLYDVEAYKETVRSARNRQLQTAAGGVEE